MTTIPEPMEEEMLEYAEYLGLDLTQEDHLRWIVLEGLNAPVPLPWKAIPQAEGEIYYFNFETGESSWDHPSDEEFKNT